MAATPNAVNTSDHIASDPSRAARACGSGHGGVVKERRQAGAGAVKSDDGIPCPGSL